MQFSDTRKTNIDDISDWFNQLRFGVHLEQQGNLKFYQNLMVRIIIIYS